MQIKKVMPDSKELLDFILLSWRLYPKNERMESTQEIEQLVAGTHILSSTLTFQAFVGYQDNQAIIRSALIQDKSSHATYLGFFEAVNDSVVMETFMAFIKREARLLGSQELVGPVNASFWLGYRMKLSNFDAPPFTGEPHNLSYYPHLWESAGFTLIERYQSNFYVKSPLDYQANKLHKRYLDFLDAGYQFSHPSKTDWDNVSIAVFHLLTDLYQVFPIFQSITAKQFAEIFSAYQQILDFTMVTLAYFEGTLVGFFIPLPDYGNLVYQKLTPINILRLLKRRKKAKRYILLYLGVDAKHLGLGSALSYIVFAELKKRQARSIGALIHQGKISNRYVAEMQVDHTEYGLFSLKL